MKQSKFGRSLLPFALAIGAAVVLPTMAHAQSVRVNWAKKAAFSDYKTYEWVPSKDTNHPFYRQYVGQFVKEDLQKKHLQEVSGAQSPDLLVTYHFLTQETMDAQTTGFGSGGFGYGGGDWGGWGMGMGDGMGMGMGMGMGGMTEATTTEVPVTMGILTVDMIDAKTKKIVWRGQASSDNVTKSTKGEENNVKKSIDKMLDHFPPK